MTLEALSLLDVILERPCRPILHSLCLASVSGRGYFNSGAAEAAIDSWSDEEDERERNRTGEIYVLILLLLLLLLLYTLLLLRCL